MLPFDWNAIQRVIADNDWDGVSAASQCQRHFSHLRVEITSMKLVPSTPHDVVLDLETDGDGWVVDHHKRERPPKRPLSYADGVPCTSTLVRLLMQELKQEPDRADLLLSATAEITEGLAHLSGGGVSLCDLLACEPDWRKPRTGYTSQYVRSDEVYVLADAMGVICHADPYEALRLGMKCFRDIRDTSQLLRETTPELRKLVESYFSYMSSFRPPSMSLRILGDFEVWVLTPSASTIGPFWPQTLTRIQRQDPYAHYLIFRDNGLSLRTDNQKLPREVLRRLGNRVKSWGGRGDRWAFLCEGGLTQNEQEQIFNSLLPNLPLVSAR